MTIEMIVAVDERGGIARDGHIPWLGQFPEDMKFFKETTTNHMVFMGRTTYFSLPHQYRPLRNRVNIVYTHTPENYDDIIDPSFCLYFSDEGPEAQQIVGDKKMFIMGGSQIYHHFYHLCDTIWVTRIQHDYQCDMFLNMDKILKNYRMVEIVKQGEKFVIEKYCKSLEQT
jgi:dihydrofolate reductase